MILYSVVSLVPFPLMKLALAWFRHQSVNHQSTESVWSHLSMALVWLLNLPPIQPTERCHHIGMLRILEIAFYLTVQCHQYAHRWLLIGNYSLHPLQLPLTWFILWITHLIFIYWKILQVHVPPKINLAMPSPVLPCGQPKIHLLLYHMSVFEKSCISC